MVRNRKNESFILNVGKFFATEVHSWHDEEPLWKVFWIYGVVRSGIIAAFYAVAIYAGYVLLQQIFGLGPDVPSIRSLDQISWTLRAKDNDQLFKLSVNGYR